MRIRINLLPHRQIKRAERQRQFNIMAAATLGTAIAIIFLGYTYISASIESQNSRNQRLKDEIAKLDNQIKEINGLKGKINELKDRIQAVESLQNNRSQGVILLDEIARQLPEAVSLKNIKQTGDTVTLEGVADTNARVAVVVKNFGNSKVFSSPQLIQIVALNQNNQKLSSFTMTLKLNPAPAMTEEAQPPKGKV
jgi:type IV pilus assembly protein PilN